MTDFPSPLPNGWFPSGQNRASQLYEELERELTPGHPLYRVAVDVVAHREGSDDILCRYRAQPSRFTVIHLSWIGKQEVDSKHPHVEADGDFEAFLRYEEAFYGR